MPTRTPHPRAGLDQADVVAAAIEIVETEGLATLTMRRLGDRLGVNPNTVYWHVGNREQLLAAIVDHWAETTAEVALRGSTPRARIADAVAQARTALVDSASIAAVAFEIGAEHRLTRPLATAIAAEFEAAGVDGVDAGAATVALLAVVSGFTVVELRARDRAVDGPAPSELSAAAWAGLTDFAHHDRAFTHAVDAILDATLLPARS